MRNSASPWRFDKNHEARVAPGYRMAAAAGMSCQRPIDPLDLAQGGQWFPPPMLRTSDARRNSEDRKVVPQDDSDIGAVAVRELVAQP